MLSAQRAIPWIGGAGIATLLAVSMFWLTVPSLLLVGTPVSLAESYWYSLPDGTRSRALYYVLTTVATIVGVLVPAASYVLLSRSVARHPVRARRYLVASALVLAILSACWYATGWSYGLKYQGRGFIYVNLAFGCAMVLALAAVAVRWRSRPTPALPMLFLWLEFAWVLVCAFPWLGETF
jgi:hypothetical protein